MKNFPVKIFFVALVFLSAAPACFAQGGKEDTSLAHFPGGSTPGEIGERVAHRFLETPHTNFGRSVPPKKITYPESCTWYGALAFAAANGDKALADSLAKRFDPLLGADSTLIPPPVNVDYTVFGIVPFELYMQTKDERYLRIGKELADRQWGPPPADRAKPEALEFYRRGYSWQTRMWIDDMYMITAVETQAYRATGDKKYIERAAKEMTLYLDSLQRPNGLFYHAPDVPFFWGRGNGWVAAGMTELLLSLPGTDPYRSRIMRGYQKMMASLLKYQTSEGVWRQLIDDPEAWPETSCTGMFAFAMITGVKKGWLDKQRYAPAARKAWLGLISYLDVNGDIRNVCEGTNKKNDRQYYLDRKRNTGDLHGQAPLLWCAFALLK